MVYADKKQQRNVQNIRCFLSPFASYTSTLQSSPFCFLHSSLFIPHSNSSRLILYSPSHPIISLTPQHLTCIFPTLIRMSGILGSSHSTHTVADVLRVAIPVGVGLASALYLKTNFPKLMGISGFSKDKVRIASIRQRLLGRNSQFDSRKNLCPRDVSLLNQIKAPPALTEP